jgi:glycosyltransferase involved in cell wall biosynthesis
VPLNILFVGNYLPGGSRPVTLDLASALARQGYGVRVTSTRTAQLPRVLDMIATVLRHGPGIDLAVIDVYSGRAFVYAEAVTAVLRALGKPYILTLHGGNLPAFARRWPGRVRRLFAGAARVTAPSAYLAEAMRGFRPDLETVANGLDAGAYRYRLRDQPAPRLLWLRAFHEIYGPMVALETVARLVRTFPGLHLTMIGPDKDGSQAAVLAAVGRLGLESRVECPGPVPKASVPAWMERADVFLNTALIDNAPVSVIEAMASGLCIASTNVGGLGYLLRDEHDALLVPPNDPDAMAAAVTRMLTQPGLAARLSANARLRAESCDWAIIVPQWQTLLSSVVPARSR